jgi:hypothetical protein
MDNIKQKCNNLLKYIQINEYRERIFPQEKAVKLFEIANEALNLLHQEYGSDSKEYLNMHKLFMEIQGKDVIPVYLG